MQSIKNFSDDKEISIISTWPIQFSQAIPYIVELNNRGVKLNFYVSKNIMQVFPEIVDLGSEVVDLDLLIRDTRISRLTHLFLKRVLLKVFHLTITWFKAPVHYEVYVNFILSWFGRILFANPFSTQKVFHITKARIPHLLCARGLRVYTLVGSWDHAKIDAAGHQSECVFVWNNELAKDWRDIQGDRNIHLCFPVPFKYLINEQPSQIRKPSSSKPLTAMYPMSSASGDGKGRFEEECKLVEALALACKRVGVNLLVKPKPYAAEGELDFLVKFSNIKIGKFNESFRKENLVLSNEYNDIRCNELSKSDMVFNVGTTFALEAALSGAPVIQLYLTSKSIFPALVKFQEMYHVKKYLLSQIDCIFEIDDKSGLEDQFFNLLTSKDVLNERSRLFSKKLANWIYPKESFDTLNSHVVDKILE